MCSRRGWRPVHPMARRTRGGSAARLAVAVVVWMTSAGASAAIEPAVDDSGFVLGWEAPAMCPDREAATTALRAQLRGAAARGSAQVVISEDAQGYAATIAIAGESPFAARRLVAGDCEALGRASVLVIAVAIDPVAVVGAMDPVDDFVPPGPVDDDDDVDPVADVSPRRMDVTPRAPARRPSSQPWSHRMRIAGGVGSQAIGAVHGAAQLGYAAVRSAVRIEVQATWGTPRTLRYDDGAGVRVQSIGFAVRGCIDPKVGIVSLPVCLGLDGGPSFGRGRGVPRSTLAINGWLAAELGAAAIVRVHSRVGIVVAADAQVALLRPAFHLGGRPEIVDAPQVGGRAIVGLELRLR